MNAITHITAATIIYLATLPMSSQNANAACSYKEYFEVLKASLPADSKDMQIIGFAIYNDKLYLNVETYSDEAFTDFSDALKSNKYLYDATMGGYTEGVEPSYTEFSATLGDIRCEKK